MFQKLINLKEIYLINKWKKIFGILNYQQKNVFWIFCQNQKPFQKKIFRLRIRGKISIPYEEEERVSLCLYRRRIPTLAGITPFLSLFLFISFLSSFHSLSFSRSISFTLSLSLSLFRSIPISFTLFSPSISLSFSLLISFPLFSPSLFLSHCLSWSSFELTILIWNQF